MAGQVNLLQQSLDECKREIARIDAFLKDWAMYAAIGDDTLPLIGGGPQAETKPENPPKEEVGKVVRMLIERRGRPIARDLLLDALEAEGIELKGKVPKMVLSTMLWRMGDQFVRLKDFGYWLKEKPFPPANYAGES